MFTLARHINTYQYKLSRQSLQNFEATASLNVGTQVNHLVKTSRAQKRSVQQIRPAHEDHLFIHRLQPHRKAAY